MAFKAQFAQILCILAISLLILSSPTFSVPQPASTNSMADAEQFNKGLESFGIRLFSELAETNRQQNIVFSPFSIQTCLAMARMGAELKTAHEMDQVMALSAQNPEDLAKKYHTILAQYENNSILKIANKIYIMQGYEVMENFNDLLTKQFFSSIDAVNFANSNAAARTINTWVKNKTNSLIKNLIAPKLLDASTRLVLVNAIHFKGEWSHQFPERGTREMDFYLDETNSVKVKMMHTSHNFKYGEFSELDATALEMPYKNSDLSMLIILPNSRTGLVSLEEKMKNVTLSDFTQRMYSTKVIVDMPKFKAEFEVELSSRLKKMGMSRMFSIDAEFGKMLKSNESLQVSAVLHKAFIEVNEKGTEAAATTGTAIRMKRSLETFHEIKEFNIQHPFAFYILQQNSSESSTTNSNLVLFAGRVVHFQEITLPTTTTTNLNEIKDEL